MTFEAARPTTKHESKYREDSQTESSERGLVNQIWSSPGHFDQNFGRSQSDLPNQSQQSAAEKHILGNFEIAGVSTAGDQSSSAIASDANNHSEIQSVKPAGEQMSTFTPGENLDQTIKYLQDPSNRHNVDYSRSFENGVRVVGLGDAWHVSMGSKDEFVSHLKELKSAGATHVGFELLPQSLESSVNRYYGLRDKAPDSAETKSARNELKQHFDSIWNSDDLYNNKMVDMLDAIHDAGLKPIGIEPDLPGMHKYSEHVPESDGLGLLNHGMKALTASDEPALKEFFSGNDTSSAREKLLSTVQQAWREYPGMAEKFMKVMDMAKESGYNASEFKLPLDEAETDRLIRSQQIWRDGAWADHIASVLSTDPQAKVVVYAGAGHFRPGTPSGDPTLTDALDQRGIASNSVGYAGADFPSDIMHEVAQNVPMVRSQLNIAAASATLGLSKQRFAIPVGPGANDWIIHLPQD